MTDIVRLINDTYRELGRRQTEGGDARYLVIRREYDATVEDVWEACTDPVRISRWLLPISGDLRLGGRYQLEGNAGGEILQCEPPHRLTLTWHFGEPQPGESSVVRLTLSPVAAGGTLFELDHAAVLELPDEIWREMIGDFGAGWETATTYLEKYLRGELPDTVITEWFNPETPEEQERNQRVGEAWRAVAANM